MSFLSFGAIGTSLSNLCSRSSMNKGYDKLIYELDQAYHRISDIKKHRRLIFDPIIL